MPTYPLSLPATEFKSLSMQLVRAVAVSESPFSFVQQSYEHSGAKWQATVTLPPMNRADAGAWQAFFIELRGMRGTFLLGDPVGATPLGTATAATANGAASAGANTLVVDGMGNAKTLLKGTYIQLGSGATSRLHMLVADTTSDGSGNGTLTFEPALKDAVSDNATVTLTNPKGVFRLSQNEIGWEISDASKYGFTFACVEAQ